MTFRPPAPRSPDHIVFVLGIARSGTSAVSGVLARLGVDFGDGLKPPDPRNPKGFYEDFETSRHAQRLLAAFGRTWSDARPLPAGWLNSRVAEIARRRIGHRLRAGFGERPVIGLKDPRIVRLLPLFLRVAADLAREPALVIVRRPRAEVVASIGRSGFFHGTFSAAAAHRLCDAYDGDLEAYTAGRHAVTVRYRDLFEDLGGTVGRLAASFDFPVRSYASAAAELEAFVDPALDHHGRASAPAERIPGRLFHGPADGWVAAGRST